MDSGLEVLVVTNRTLAGDELIWWSRHRCGKGEEVHGVATSGFLFGANAVVGDNSAEFRIGVRGRFCVPGVGPKWESRRMGSPVHPDRPSGPCGASR